VDSDTYGLDVNKPSVARMYDHLLDGRDNYPADREAVDELLKQVPSMKVLAINNRRFLQRVVYRLAADHGIRQFIDHGSGLPTQDNVHDIAQRVDPGARVVYVDIDPIVLAHGGALLARDERTAVVQADMRDTEGIFGHQAVRDLIDFEQPVAALFVSVLHCIPDDDAEAVIRNVMAKLPAGSFMVICQLVSEDKAVRDYVTDFMAESTGGHWGRVREQADVHRYFEGLEIMPPGLMEVSTWLPDSDLAPKQATHEWIEYGGLGRVIR
jgi:O-methyltransferase involved in polyketide biosynthesis